MNDTSKVCDFNHLILYAKGWYKKTDFLDDIRKILAHRCGMDEHFMPSLDIWTLLVHAANKYLSDYDREEIWTRMFSGSHVDDPSTHEFLKWEGQTSWLRPAKMIVSKLSCVEVKGILNLGRPDPTVLPLTDDNSMARWDELNKS